MIDNRHLQTPIRQQGDRPTCVGFAVSSAHGSIAGDSIVRAPEHAMWAGHQVRSIPGLEATAVAWSLEGLQADGHAIESAWPYGTPHWSLGPPAAVQLAKNRRPAPSWRELGALTLDLVRSELSRGNAVVLTLRVVHAAWRQPGGIIDAVSGLKTRDNHAVAAVGASETGETPEEVVIKNSWGPHWGDHGYGRVSARYLVNYGVCAHTLAGSKA